MASNGISGPHGFDGGVAPFAVASPARTASDTLPTFAEVLRALNPLQYVPVVGSIYRVITGDQGSPGLRTAASAIGGMLMGGPFGLLLSMAGSLVERMFHVEDAAHSLIAGRRSGGGAGVIARHRGAGGRGQPRDRGLQPGATVVGDGLR